MFTVMTNIENRCGKIFTNHYFDADPLGTGFESLSEATWLFFSENKRTFTFPEYLKPYVYGVKTPKQEGSATLEEKTTGKNYNNEIFINNENFHTLTKTHPGGVR